MKQYTINDVRQVLMRIGEICISNQDLLTDLDSKLGDGDMGISMSRGAEAVCKELNQFDTGETDITKLFLSCAMIFNRYAPSTLGTLLSFGMMEIGKNLNHSTEISLETAVSLPLLLADTISAKGKAQVGDKTILDALYPYARTLKTSYTETENLNAALEAAAMAAEAGMESTKNVKARTGRASWLDSRNMEYPDAGAVLCTLVAKEMGK